MRGQLAIVTVTFPAAVWATIRGEPAIGAGARAANLYSADPGGSQP
jgi:hypothetical protein